MDRLKRHAALPVLAAALLVLAIVSISLYAANRQATFRLEHLAGEASWLDDMTLEGVLHDGYHRTPFVISGGQVRFETEIMPRPIQVRSQPHSERGQKTIGERRYEVFPEDMQQYIVRYQAYVKGTGNYRPERGEVSVRVPIQITMEGKQMGFSNLLEYGLTELAGETYFTVPTLTTARGSNGIYRIDFASGESAEIVTFSLEGNRAGEDVNGNVQVLGLESVGNRLVLIVSRGQSLEVHAYDAASGRAMGKAVVADFNVISVASPPNTGEENVANDAADHSAERFYEDYDAYRDSSGHLLLSFLSNRSDTEQVWRTVVSLDMTAEEQAGGIALLDRQQLNWPNVREGYNDGAHIVDASYREDVLYIARMRVDHEQNAEERSRSYYADLYNRSLLLEAYRDEKLLYQGLLVTDANEDNNQAANVYPGPYGYSEYEHRRFDDVSWTN
ncbi:hypothetical protein EBB07_08980 [Paenibacillaceae bacterium]|nr:hypothetical protein EBB07_08980 [Paenibacillaceae bacterium]